MLSKSGGRKRVQDFASQRGIDVDAQQLHHRKTEIFDSLMTKETLMLRPGVASVISYAMDNNLQLAFVTSTSEANIAAVFSTLRDQVKSSDFNFIPPRNYLFEANEHKGCSISSSSESLVAQNVKLGLIIGWS